MNIKIKKHYCAFAIFAVAMTFMGQAVYAAEISDNIIMQANQERQKQGLAELNENELLNQAARSKAQDMLEKDYFAHTSPEGIDPWHWLEQADYQYKYAGENLAMDFSSASSVHKAWMKSESHKENILSERYSEIGVAVVEGSIENRQTRIAVQFFGTPLSVEQVAIADSALEKFDTSVQIMEASVQPLEGEVNDEMLVYAQVSGEPSLVEVHFGGQKQQLEKLSDQKYMNLVALDDINLQSDSVVIKAEMDSGQALFYQIPQEQYLAYVKGNATQGGEHLQVAKTQTVAQVARTKSFNAQNVALGIFMLCCIILITNVWILEKEEEKLIKACGT